MTKFKPGQSGNPEGKMPGTLNRSTPIIREQIEGILNEQFNSIQLAKDLAAIEPFERLKIFLRLLEFVLPKQKAVELKLDFEKLTDQDLDKIIDGLKHANDGQD